MAAPAPASTSAAPAAPFCRGCGYALRGLPSGNCPECGRAFDLADRRSYARRPPRLRLRWWAWRIGLLALVLLLAAGSVPAWYWWGWHREQAAIAVVRGAGGHVTVQRVELGGAARFLPARWAFLHERADTVNFRGDGTAALDRFDLSPLTHVHALWLLDGDVTDAALARLRGMTRLEVLALEYSARLDGTGVRHLGACQALTVLHLDDTGLTDAGVAEVGQRTTLTELSIERTPVTDEGMRHLVGMTSLRRLDLRGTGVTDAGLVPLRGLTSLRALLLRGSKVTEQGRRDLQKALPNLTIQD